jgi:hypothetical protein
VAAIEPGNSSTDLDAAIYYFLNGTLQNIYHVGNLDYDLPLA